MSVRAVLHRSLSIGAVAIVFLSALATIPPAFAKPQAATLPGTPAGRLLKAWLDAFNSGDRARIEAYYAKHAPWESVDETVDGRKQSGGFELLGVDKSLPLHLAFRLKEKASPAMVVGTIDVKDADPPQVMIVLNGIPPGMTAADVTVKVDAPFRSRLIDGVVAKLTEFYVYPDGAKKMIDALQAHQKNGDYDALEDGSAFAVALTVDLQAVSNDKHLRVEFVPTVVPKLDLPPDREREIPPAMRARAEHDNCGFEKVERLESNIGYVKFNFFGPPSVCGATATAAMNFLANVDALIVDLRDNGGGDPKMVAFVSSYLFNERTHLNDLYNRKEDKTTEFWTEPDVPGKKLAGKPVFVLTAKRTFSGAEEFSYNLKNLKRATIVGETTGGGAHPTRGLRLDDHFMIGVPFARAVNPVTKTDWEGKGVEPDVKVPAAQALDIAKKMATDQIAKKQPEKK